MFPFSPASIRSSLLLASLCAFAFVALAESPASINSYPRKDGEALTQVVSRRGGGSYAVFGDGVPTRVVAVRTTNPYVNATGQWTDTTEYRQPAQTSATEDEYSSTDGANLGDDAGTPPAVGFRIVRLDDAGNTLGEIRITGTRARVTEAIAGPDGSLYVIGTHRGADFPAVRPIFPNLYGEGMHRATTLGFVLKTTPGGTAIERSTLFGGNQEAALSGVTVGVTQGTTPYDITLDRAGNVYITGATAHMDFPVSENAAKRDPKLDIAQKSHEGFLMKLDSGLNRLIYSTFFGTDANLNEGCLDDFGTSGLAVRVVGNNEAVVYASAKGQPIPSTQGAYERLDPANGAPACYPIQIQGGMPFWTEPAVTLLRFDSAGSQVMSAARIGRTRWSGPQTNPLHTTRDGNLLVALNANPTESGREIRLLRLDNTLSAVLTEKGFDVDFGLADLSRLAVQNDGTIWAAGTMPSVSGDFAADRIPEDYLGAKPITNLGTDFLLQIDALNLTTQRRWMLPMATISAALRTDDFTVKPSSMVGLELNLPSSGDWAPAVLGIANAAGGSVQNTVSPYEFLSFYGIGFAEDAASGTSFDRSGALPTVHNGISVLINGTPSPLLYVGDSQINLIVPASVANLAAGSSVPVRLVVNGAVAQEFTLTANSTNPNLFRASGDQASLDQAVFNQNGSLNSMHTPLSTGDHGTVYLNGLGAPDNRIPAGNRVNDAVAWSGFEVKIQHLVQVSGDSTTGPVYEYREIPGWAVSYLGTVPGAAAGTLQVNFKTPNDIRVESPNITINQLVYLEFTDTRGTEPKVLTRIPIRVWLHQE